MNDTAEARNNHSVEVSAERELNNQWLQQGIFSCRPDAQKEIAKFAKKCSYCRIVSSNVIKEEVPKRGRKPKVEKPVGEKECHYQVSITIEINQDSCNVVRRNKSFFVIATNDIERDW